MDIVFSVRLGSLVLRTKNIHCICVCLGSHVCMDIVFSVCLGSHACVDIVFGMRLGSLSLRRKNILWICVCLGLRACRLYGHCI